MAELADPVASETIGILDWSHCIEDFLDNIGIPLEAYLRDLTGGWLFGYVEALQLAGYSVVVFVISRDARTVRQATHSPTGASVCILPSPFLYRLTRRFLPNPYASTIEDAACSSELGFRRPWLILLKNLAPYLSTPMFTLWHQLDTYHSRILICQEYENPRFDLCALLLRGLGYSVFGTFQGGTTCRGVIEKILRPLAMKKASGLIIASMPEQERVKARYQLDATKIQPIFNPLDVTSHCLMAKARNLRPDLGIPASAVVICWHGRIDFYRKGLDLLLNAWSRVEQDPIGRDAYLLLVGTGENAAMVTSMIAENRLTRVIWINQYINDRAKIYSYLTSSDLYVFPSRHEGFPVAPIEAMACGLPVLASCAPGIEDIFPNGAHSGGVLVPVGDLDRFSEELLRLIASPTLCRQLGLAGKLRAESAFSLKSISQQFIRLFRQGQPVEP
jgi:starch synthase